MESGVVFDIKRFALHDGPGIRTTVFLKGCPLRCLWCHNPEGIDRHISSFINQRKLHGETFFREEAIGRELSSAELYAEIERDRPFFEESNGGVTFSGGEPLLQYSFLARVMDLCHESAIECCVDTSGYGTESAMREVAERADLMLFDLKHPDPAVHKQITGVELSVIRDNLSLAAELCRRIWIRIPVIPNNNYSLELVDEYRELIELSGSSLEQVNLLPFHATADHKYRRLNRENPMSNIPSLDSCDLEPMASALRSYGYNVVVGG